MIIKQIPITNDEKQHQFTISSTDKSGSQTVVLKMKSVKIYEEWRSNLIGMVKKELESIEYLSRLSIKQGKK